ncbi:MAG: hypothetical protein QW057_01635 [Candidatus Bathyarchaeia archaeon]
MHPYIIRLPVFLSMHIVPDLFVEKKAEAARLFNIIKNRRRIALLEILAQCSRSLTELRREMRRLGFDHSQTTIFGYLVPLLETGLVQPAAGRYVVTTRGLTVMEVLAGGESGFALPENSNCDEELLLVALKASEAGCEKLLGPKPAGDFGRTVRRLENIGFLHREKSASRALYRRRPTAEPSDELSATEKRLYDLIPEEGATVHDLSQRGSISVRRTFKYLRTLREKGLIQAEKPSAKLALTPKGKEYADLLVTLAKVLESPVELPFTAAQDSLAPSDSPNAGSTGVPKFKMPRQTHGAYLVSEAIREPCDLRKPLDAPGLSGQKLYRCDRYELTIGEYPAVCETCKR